MGNLLQRRAEEHENESPSQGDDCHGRSNDHGEQRVGERRLACPRLSDEQDRLAHPHACPHALHESECLPRLRKGATIAATATTLALTRARTLLAIATALATATTGLLRARMRMARCIAVRTTCVALARRALAGTLPFCKPNVAERQTDRQPKLAATR